MAYRTFSLPPTGEYVCDPPVPSLMEETVLIKHADLYGEIVRGSLTGFLEIRNRLIRYNFRRLNLISKGLLSYFVLTLLFISHAVTKWAYARPLSCSDRHVSRQISATVGLVASLLLCGQESSSEQRKELLQVLCNSRNRQFRRR